MNTAELSHILTSVSPQTWNVGVFARDEFAEAKLTTAKQKQKCMFICNTDCSHKPGRHWVVLCIDGQGKNTYFDSYGLPPFHKEFSTFLNKNYVYNDIQLQEPFTTVCGHYCVLFARFMFAGYSMEEIIHTLEPYTDEEVKAMVLQKLS